MQVLTIEETAKYLKVPESQIYTLVRCEGFPAFKVGKHWRISKDLLDRWVEQQITTTANY